VIGVNPVRTGYNAVADEWVGITPGTDGLLILALVHELLKARQDRSRLSDPLHQRALAGDRRSRRSPITAVSRATTTASRWWHRPEDGKARLRQRRA
jgi:anaerobic selenocysteine-containing dehydrogenase